MIALSSSSEITPRVCSQYRDPRLTVMTACKNACLGTLLALVTASCGRKVTYYKPPPVHGLRFFAISQITGGARDSLYVRVSARNDAKEQRQLESGVCDDPLTIRVYRGDASRRSTPIWDST